MKNRSKPIRILHVFGEMNLGGAETMIMNVYREIDKTKVQFDFVVHTDKECAYDREIINMGGKILRVPRYKGINHFQYAKSWEDLLENHRDYSIIHSHVRSTASIFLKIAKKFNLNTLIHSHNTSSGKGIKALWKNHLQKNITEHADYLLACSVTAGQWLYGHKEIQNNNFMVIHNAINVSNIEFNLEKRNIKRRELNLTDKQVVGHVGRFHPQKNHHKIIELFEHYLKINRNAHLLLVGEGELKTEIKQKIIEKNLKDRVTFYGLTNDVQSLLSAMDIMLFPSVHEGLPLVLVEAQANGLPVLASDSITEEVRLSDYITFESLNHSNDTWLKTMDKILKGNNRNYSKNNIKGTKYDVAIESRKLLNLYTELSIEG